MSTAIFELALSIPVRIGELTLLVQQAKSVERDNEALYNALCRATAVLLASHLEGFVKELTSALIADLNDNVQSFDMMPKAIQHAFCEKIAFFENVERSEFSERIRQLKAFFTENSVRINLKAFTYRESTNKNSTASFIDGTFSKICASDILHTISSECFCVVFDNDRRTDYRLLRDLSRYRSNFYSYPYSALPSSYKFRPKRTKDAS